MNSMEARAAFPCGLEQPEGTFRCSEDALLLANFAAHALSQTKPATPQHKTDRPLRFADLGTGCGVVSFGLLLRMPHLSGYGLDCNPTLIDAAGRNAHRLGLAHAFNAHLVDVTDQTALRSIRNTHGAVDMVIANPPWRDSRSGRLPSSPARRQALFGDAETLAAFSRAATALLTQHGRYCWLCGAERLPDMLAAVQAATLTPVRLAFVHHTPNSPALFALCEARRTSRAALEILPPQCLTSYR